MCAACVLATTTKGRVRSPHVYNANVLGQWVSQRVEHIDNYACMLQKHLPFLPHDHKPFVNLVLKPKMSRSQKNGTSQKSGSENCIIVNCLHAANVRTDEDQTLHQYMLMFIRRIVFLIVPNHSIHICLLQLTFGFQSDNTIKIDRDRNYISLSLYTHLLLTSLNSMSLSSSLR